MRSDVNACDSRALEGMLMGVLMALRRFFRLHSQPSRRFQSRLVRVTNSISRGRPGRPTPGNGMGGERLLSPLRRTLSRQSGGLLRHGRAGERGRAARSRATGDILCACRNCVLQSISSTI